jgi:hypothetical protein
MFPFWDSVIKPLVEAAAPARVVEIGALRGDTTERLLESLGPTTEVHVIDPAPQFDPAEHAACFGDRYVFHRDLSLRVLEDFPPVDVALVDGDHNWYTVYHELRLLEANATRAGGPLPVIVMHDVSWPYGRRDGYYAPDQIPPEYRQPCARRGIVRGKSALATDGGLNAHIHNADHEGGPRNGVLTALEDFTAATTRALRVVVLPIYVGLAIATDQARLVQHPRLNALIDDLDTDDGRERTRRAAEEVVARVHPLGPATNR